jgi:hypothetical protein
MEMFNKKVANERIGSMKKSKTLDHLKEVEKHFLMLAKKYKIEASYDVVANELPYFKTLGYTEWAHCFMINPLQQLTRMTQMEEAYLDNCEVEYDYVSYFKDKILNNDANKYENIKDTENFEPRDALVVLVGSNHLKDRVCLNKLKYIRDKHDSEVWFKPHPITTHQIIGEMKDIFGEEIFLERNDNMYKYLIEANTVYTSHMSESALYAVCLDKEIEPIDAFYKVEQGSFYHISKFLFTLDDPKEWINRTLNSPKSGIINPEVDDNWKLKLEQYMEYIMEKRNKNKYKYIDK